MLTPVDVENIRKTHVKYVGALAKSLSASMKQDSPQQFQSIAISVGRLNHQYDAVAKAFNKVAHRANKVGYMRAISKLDKVCKHKYMPTVLAIMELTHQQNIPLDRWILAQAETIRLKLFTLFHCYGANALSRYESWEARQQRKYLRESERKEQTHSKETTIARSVIDGHVSALKWRDTLTQIAAPCVSVALWYMWPYIDSWYMLAYEEFRMEIMESKLCDSPMLVKRWKRYKTSPRIQETCARALETAIQNHGKLEW